MNRRAFLAWMGMGAAALAARRSAWAAGGSKQGRYNLLIYHCDELNFRTLGCYRKLMKPDEALVWGPKAELETPNIDRIASAGAICTSFYATTPLCSPSRSSFVTGRYPQNTPVTTNNVPMSDKVVTFAEVLRRVGYATGYAGKWHLDGDGKPQWAPKRQFGFADNRYMYNRGHYKQMEDTPACPRVKARDAHNKPTYDVKGADAKSFTTDYLTDKAMEFVRAHKDQPFCYMLSVPDPHGPNSVRPPYDTMFNNVPFRDPQTMHKPASAVPPWAPKQRNSLPARLMQQYFGMIKCIDDNVGKMLAELDKLGLADRTIVVFTADHGDLCGEHGRTDKSVPYEGSARIPFLIRAPGLVKPGTVVKEALGCVDFAPTILRLMGMHAPLKADGRYADTFFRGSCPGIWKDVTFLRGASRPGGSGQWLAAVTPRYKLVVSPLDKPWLFDLEKDPDEVKNFFDDPTCRDDLRELAKALLDYGKKYNDPDTEQPLIKADLEWMAKGTGPYHNPPRPKPPARKKGKRGRKAAKKE